jgi:TonB family protein
MDLARRHLWTFIAASAGFHLAIGVLLFVPTLKPLRPLQAVSVLQVSLVNGEEVLQRYKPIAPPVAPAVANTTDGGSAESEPAREPIVQTEPDGVESARTSSEPYALEGSASRNEPAVESGSRSDELTHFLQDVKGRLEQAKQYPWLARVQGQEGTARVQFMINRSGEVQDVNLLESSRSKILDDEAVATVKRAGRFSRPPIAWQENVRIRVPLVFQLNSSSIETERRFQNSVK